MLVNARASTTSLYELGEPLGRGSMGVVYRALDRMTGGAVALKRVRSLPSRDASDTATSNASGERPIGLADLRLALAREFRTLATLRHPNVISVYDFGFDTDGEPFFTMELLDRPTSITHAVRDLGFEDRVALLLETLDALAYLHRHGLVHRDLKPSNIAVAKGHVKLLDFGVSSKTFGHDVVVGTVRYMAPEVLRGEPAERASDLFSFGIVAYQCLLGRHPFESANDEAVSWKIQHDEPDFRLSHAPSTDPVEAPTRVLREGRVATTAPAEDRDAEPVGEVSRVGPILRALLAKDATARPTAEDVARELATAIGRTHQAVDGTHASFATAARFVGRQAELRALTERLDSVVTRRRGSVCLVGGESGVGKSRLVDELRTLALVRGVTVVTGQAASESTTPFDIWVSILRWLALTLRDPSLTAVVTPYVPDLQSAAGGALPQLPALAGAAALRRLVAAVESGLRRLDGPTLFILEDLHWAGSESISLLRQLVGKASELPLVVLGTYRDDENPNLAKELGADQLRLGRHTFAEIRELSEAMLGHAGASFAFAEFLFHETEGNAFLATEVARSIPPPSGGPASAPPASKTRSRLESIRRVLERRLAKLDDASLRLLEVAAVAGRELDPPLLRDVTQRSEREIQTFALEAGGLLEAVGADYRFRHDKFREAILDAMTEADRQSIHLRIADALERRIGEAPDAGAAGRLAHHLTAGGKGERALPYLQIAATDAIARYANKEAVRYLETAIAIVEGAPVPDGRRLLVFYKLLAPALIATRGYAALEVTKAYARARDLAAELALGAADVFPINFGLWLYELVRGDMHASLVAARACASASDDADLAVEAHRALGATSYYLGNFAEADAHLRRAITAHDPVRHADHGFRFGGDPGVVCHLYLSLTCCFRGRADEAVTLADEALAAARGVRHPFSEAYALGFRAWTFQLLGDLERAAESAQRATHLSEEHGFPFWIGFGTMLDGWIRARLGAEEAREGDRLMRRALEILRATGAGLWESYWSVLLADAALARGATSEAAALLRGGVAHAETMGERFALPLLLTSQATVRSREEEPDEAASLALLDRARALAKANDDRLGALRSSLERARLCAGRDREAEAQTLLAEDRAPFVGQAAARHLLIVPAS